MEAANIKKSFFPLLGMILIFHTALAQTENVIIITTDGLRWQEVFEGMDSATRIIAALTKVTATIFTKIIGRQPPGNEEKN